jgi:NAD(P)-dependent dehydrogenase (short-subunit alcohol dehydrogenase family)
LQKQEATVKNKFEGKVAVITGRRKDALDRAVTEVGKNVIAVQGDVASLTDLDRLYAEVAKKDRKIDVIFANAGVAQLAPFDSVDEKFYDLHFDAIWVLPIPATYVVDRDGTIALGFVDVDYRNRLEPAEILSALQSLSKEKKGIHNANTSR